MPIPDCQDVCCQDVWVCGVNHYTTITANNCLQTPIWLGDSKWCIKIKDNLLIGKIIEFFNGVVNSIRDRNIKKMISNEFGTDNMELIKTCQRFSSINSNSEAPLHKKFWHFWEIFVI